MTAGTGVRFAAGSAAMTAGTSVWLAAGFAAGTGVWLAAGSAAMTAGTSVWGSAGLTAMTTGTGVRATAMLLAVVTSGFAMMGTASVGMMIAIGFVMRIAFSQMFCPSFTRPTQTFAHGVFFLFAHAVPLVSHS